MITVTIDKADIPGDQSRYHVIIRGIPHGPDGYLVGHHKSLPEAKRVQAAVIAALAAYTGPEAELPDKDLWDHLSEDEEP